MFEGRSRTVATVASPLACSPSNSKPVIDFDGQGIHPISIQVFFPEVSFFTDLQRNLISSSCIGDHLQKLLGSFAFWLMLRKLASPSFLQQGWDHTVSG